MGDYKKPLRDAIRVLEDNYNGKPYLASFSGGKDSVVMLDVVKKSGVPYKATYNVTTLDPPELIRFIKAEHPEVVFSRPVLTPEQLVDKKYMMPTRRCRYCCDFLKERKGPRDGSIHVLGVRKEESPKRAALWSEVTVPKKTGDTLVCPIVEWDTEEIWEYINGEGLAYCSLYDEGWKRLGCVGCPILAGKRRLQEFERWPHVGRRWRRLADRSYLRLKDREERGVYRGNWRDEWTDSDGYWKWWLSI